VSEFEEVGRMESSDGSAILFGTRGPHVLLGFTSGDPEPTTFHLTAAAREHFQRLFMEAERRAEAHHA
jgi:hypothetical protein